MNFVKQSFGLFCKDLIFRFSTAVTNLLLPQIAHSEKGKKIAFDQLKSSHAILEHDIKKKNPFFFLSATTIINGQLNKNVKQLTKTPLKFWLENMLYSHKRGFGEK
jgi:hypothetical protein